MMIDDLILLSGNDIPFPEGQLIIHQPTIKEIAYIGEETFFVGCQLLNFSKDMLEKKDKDSLESFSNFEVLMSMINDSNVLLQKQKVNMMMVLAIIFPVYKINITKECIEFIDEENNIGQLNKDNFEAFKKILNVIFAIKKSNDEDYEPKGALSKKIAEKLKERQRKLAALKSEENKKIAIFSRYISILSVGLSKDINSLFNYTVYQLFDEFQRYELKVNFDFYMQAKMAGAQDLKEVDDWMKDIHS